MAETERRSEELKRSSSVDQKLTAGTSRLSQDVAPVTKAASPPPEQEISVNLVYTGFTPAPNGKMLDFDFKALWGDYKQNQKPVSMSASKGKTEARLNLDVAKMRVVPKIVSSTRGQYDLELTDPAGKLIGGFSIADSGKQVNMNRSPSSYSTELIYYEPERRLTGYAVYKPGSRKPVLGVIFVGKGWSYVEQGKKPDMSKGYIFPEVDMVVLPKAWMEANDYEIKETCNTLKKGDSRLGGVCYS